jgi:hypothetical protein
MGTIPMEIGANICKSNNSILPGVKKFTCYFKKYSSDITEFLHRGGTCDGQPTYKFWRRYLHKQELTVCPLISTFVILTIRGPQNACAHQVHLLPHFSYYRPPKITPVRGLPYLAVYKISSKNLKSEKMQKNRGRGHPAEFSEKCNHVSSADNPAFAG